MAARSFKGRHVQEDMILQSVRWDLAYSLSYRDIEELMHERGFSVDHSTINRWVPPYSPQVEATFRLKKKRVENRWRMDETYSKVKGQWTYYYRAIDIELMAMIKKGQMKTLGGDRATPAEMFYALAA